MKKIILLFLIIMGEGFLYSQEITPYYPTKESREAWLGYTPTQLTYYDDIYVQGAIMNFISANLGMTNIDMTANRKKKEFTSIFQDRFSTGKLYVTYKYDTIDVDIVNPTIIKSLVIRGDSDRVISFFVQFWKTNYHSDDLKENIIRRHLQDVATFYYSKGRPYIEVKNSAFSSVREFEAYFKDKLMKNK